MDPAFTVYEAALVERPRRGKSGSHVAQPLDLIVRRLDDGVVIVHTGSEHASPETLLATVQADLLHMSHDEFLAEWKMPS